MQGFIWMYGILGVVIGSFLNVCIDRLPENKSIAKTPSHCPNCQKRIPAYDLVPVLSYLILRGRCRFCGEKIPLRVLLVELLTGAVFILVWARFGQSWETLVISLYCCLLIVIAFIDLEHQKILNILVFPSIAAGTILTALLHFQDIWSYLLGGFVGFAVLFLIAVLVPGAMGMGDVKLIIFLGVITGFPAVVVVLFLGFVLGGIIAGTLLVAKRINRKDAIAFGPFLALAGFIVLLYGGQILEWWTRMVSG